VSIFGQPDDITTGPDGNLWFTMPNGPDVSRITTGGVVTAFPLAFNTGPQGVAAGSDGAIWFLERFTNRVGRMATNGTGLVETSLGITPDAGLEEIAAGADGNLWFTEFSADKVGRITPAGNVTEFPLTPGSGPEGITAGPDGNVWFAEVNGNRIGRVTPDGVVTEFGAGISSGAGPRDITLGPDGNLWFTESSGNRIGRVVLDPPQAATVGAVDVTPTSARLTATVNPMDYPTDHTFDFGRTAAYGSQTAPAPSGSGQGNVVVASTVTGLTPETTYHFRVVARSRVGTATGADATFTTPPDPDRDRDGFPRPADCRDDRADIFPGARDKPGDRIDQDCSGRDARFPTLRARVSGFFAVFQRYSVFTSLSVRNVDAGTTIRLRCRGGRDRGCPFRAKTRHVRRTTRNVNLLRTLKRARLERGVVFELRITKPGFVGKRTRWTMRSPRVPKRTDRCLPPGSTRARRC
jgi:hypothetical protein